MGGKFPSCVYDPKFTPCIHHSIALVSTPANYLVSLLTYKAFAERFECRFLMREGDVPHEKNGEK